jgi:Multiple myeloma tumor-associated
MFTPIREGNRGGRGLFSWEDVRVMSYRDRECYLGSTVSLGFLDKGGRWRKKDWWVKTDKEKSQQDLDIQKVKEEDLNNIKQALGIIDNTKNKKTLTESEKSELLKKTSRRSESVKSLDESFHGLGFEPKVPKIGSDEDDKHERRDKHKPKSHKRHKKHRAKEY